MRRKRSPSPGTAGASVCTVSSRIDFREAIPAKEATTSLATAPQSNGSRVGGCAPDSNRDSSSRSSTSEAMRSAFARILERKRFAVATSSRPPSSRASTKPRIDVRGVRSSCEAFATKSRRIRSTRWRSLTSLKVMTAPCASPGEAGNGTPTRTKDRPVPARSISAVRRSPEVSTWSIRAPISAWRKTSR